MKKSTAPVPVGICPGMGKVANPHHQCMVGAKRSTKERFNGLRLHMQLLCWSLRFPSLQGISSVCLLLAEAEAQSGLADMLIASQSYETTWNGKSNYSRLRRWLARNAAKFFIVFCHLYIHGTSVSSPLTTSHFVGAEFQGMMGMTVWLWRQGWRESKNKKNKKTFLYLFTKKHNDSFGDVQTLCMLVPNLVWPHIHDLQKGGRIHPFALTWGRNQLNRIWNTLRLCFGSLISVHLKHAWIASERTYKISDWGTVSPSVK